MRRRAPAVGVITALRARGYTGTIVGNDVLSPESVFKKMGQAVVGVPFPISFSPTVSDIAGSEEIRRRLSDEVRQPRPTSIRRRATQVVWFFAQGLKSVSGTPTRESVANALAQVKTIDHNVYGGETINNGQAETSGTLIVAWTKRRQARRLDAAEVTRGRWSSSSSSS